MAAPKYCECGRKILVPVQRRSKRKVSGKKGRLPKHDLCRECWRRLGLGLAS